MKNSILMAVLSSIILTACEKEEKGSVVVYTAAGNVQSKLDEFRAALGALNNAPGAVGGRREVSWDGVPDSLLDKSLPKDFFNPTGPNASASLQRGLAYSDGEFRVSATGFASVNGEASTEFSAFSGAKVFANVSNFQWPVGFEVAGEKAPASVSAFGAVFTDVDKEGSVGMEFFEDGESLGKFFVPAQTAGTKHSFLGVRFSGRKITRVQIIHEGRLVEGQKDVSQGGTTDLIALDDFIYSEPVRR